ncbi:hypothetical protein FGU65_13435 [Methanoculleus sp. FWC-SCC1]|uniref:Dret-0059-like sensor domain-containing protein n=1 Tax=Methanoculleus frigidifontis TaxID=2584085 RepID=A0ABT8MD61_9EURY|nr:PDC sensor domain-containing protein [Methanoculleus sp. FWC-SCC1]MDN7025871.1 hypothetical protein [Methanoculleus sp. FWC-SCC1]
MKRKTSVPVCVLLLLTAAVCGCTGASETGDACSDVAEQKEMLVRLNLLQGRIDGALALLDARVETTAQNLTATGLAGADAEALLAETLAADRSVTTAITIARNGTCLAAVPGSVASLVGEDLGEREVVRETFERKVPVMTDVVPLQEGGQAAIIEYPVFSEDERLAGATSITFDPCLLLREEIEPVLSGTPYTAMVAEAGGRVLYDPDSAEVGKETFSESLYAEFPEVIAFARTYAGNWSGHATYSFYDTGFSRTVQKEAYWTTVGLHGTEWRLIVIREIGGA